jgi:hypothetical protein
MKIGKDGKPQRNTSQIINNRVHDQTKKPIDDDDDNDVMPQKI